jgi:hypothetical protein
MSTTTTQEMDAARNYYRGERIPKPALKVMDAATAELETSGTAAGALKTGDTAPDFILPNVDGRSVRLYTELERGPVVLGRAGVSPHFLHLEFWFYCQSKD